MNRILKLWNKQFKKEVNYFPIVNAFCVSDDNRIKILKDILKSTYNHKFSKYDIFLLNLPPKFKYVNLLNYIPNPTLLNCKMYFVNGIYPY